MLGFSTEEPPNFADSVVAMMRQRAQHLAQIVSAHGGGPLIRTPLPQESAVEEDPDDAGSSWMDVHAEIIRRGWATDEMNQALGAIATDDEREVYLLNFFTEQNALRARP